MSKKDYDEAISIVDAWNKGNKCELCKLPDNVLFQVEKIAKSENRLSDLARSAEYAWHEKYARDEDLG